MTDNERQRTAANDKQRTTTTDNEQQRAQQTSNNQQHKPASQADKPQRQPRSRQGGRDIKQPTTQQFTAGFNVSTTATTKRKHTQATKERNRRILAESDVCHICGEHGADSVDHVNPVTPRNPGAAWNLHDPEAAYNLKPAHHDTPNSRGKRCNRVKSNKPPDLRLTWSRDW